MPYQFGNSLLGESGKHNGNSTLRRAIGEERNQQRNVIDVFQMRSNVHYTSRKFGLHETEL